MSNEIAYQSESIRRTIGGTIVAVLVAAFCVLYMLNLTFGVDLIPDVVPIFGNLDDGLIMVLLLGCLKYLGIDIPLTKSTPKQ